MSNVGWKPLLNGCYQATVGLWASCHITRPNMGWGHHAAYGIIGSKSHSYTTDGIIRVRGDSIMLHIKRRHGDLCRTSTIMLHMGR
jgi:hypothetical protein